jgi:hypothetical protein
MNTETENLILFYKEESHRLGLLSHDLETFWITYRIMDYFYTQTIQGNLKQPLMYYCQLLNNSSVLAKYGSLSQMIQQLSKNEQTIVQNVRDVLTRMAIPYQLNPGSVITILQMCSLGKIFSYGGSRSKKSKSKQLRRKKQSRKKKI